MKLFVLTLLLSLHLLPEAKTLALPDFSTVDIFTDGQRVVRLSLGKNSAFQGTDEGSPATYNSIDCSSYNNRSLLDDVRIPAVKRVSQEDMLLLLDICHNMPARGSEHSHRHKRFVIPGTKWCGLGDVASDYTDLGTLVETDRCCRTHDHCPDTISPFSTKNGITNWSILHRFNCDCEERFYSCLKDVREENAAFLIGRLYFNLLKPKCYKIGHPTRCGQKGWWFTCKQRIEDTSRPEEWRFYKFWKSF